MDINTIITLISNLLIVIGIGFIYFHQRNQMKSLKTEVKANNEIITNMKSYMEIFKIDELKKYVDIKEETGRLEADQKIRKQQKELIDRHSKVLNAIGNKFGQETADILKFCVVLITFVEPEYRENIIKDGIENEMIRNTLLEIHKTIGDAHIDNGFFQHEFVKAVTGKPSLLATLYRGKNK